MTRPRTDGPGGWQLDRIDPSAVADLRRRHARELTEAVLSGARSLDPQDRALLEAVYDHGVPASELARLRGEPARTVRRRVRRLAQRIASPGFNFVLLHKAAWTPTRRRVAECCVLRGVSMRAAAEQLGTSLHNVRKEMNAINALIDVETNRAQAATAVGGTAAARESTTSPPGQQTRGFAPRTATPGRTKSHSLVNAPPSSSGDTGVAPGPLSGHSCAAWADTP